MKIPLRLFLLLLAIVLIVPAMTAANSPAQAQKEMQAPPPPPDGVSPANPDINPPAIGMCRCPNCGAECPQMGKQARLNRPQLGSRNARMVDNPDRNHGFNRSGRRHASCDMQGGMCMDHKCGSECRGACDMRGGMRMDHKCGSECRGACDMRGGKHGLKKSGKSHRGDRPGMRNSRGGNHGMRGHMDGDAAMRLTMHAKELDLTKEQVAKLEKLSYDTKAKVIDLRAAMEKQKLEMQELHRSGSDDLTAITRQLKAIADIRVELQTAKIANRIEARKILTDKQKEKLEKRLPRMKQKSDD